MINDLTTKTPNELKDLAVANFTELTDTIKEMSKYKITQLAKNLAIPRYTMMSHDDLYKAIVSTLSTETSEFASAISVTSENVDLKEIAPREVSFKLLTNTSLEDVTYPASTSLHQMLEKLGMSNKAVAIRGEMIPRSRMDQTLEQLGADGTIVAVITKTSNA